MGMASAVDITTVMITGNRIQVITSIKNITTTNMKTIIVEA